MSGMDDPTLSYLAGCLDSDGYFTIRYDSWPTKSGKSGTYQEEIGLRQVTPVVPYMLRDAFGGNVYLTRAYRPQGRPLYSWTVTSRKAALAAERVLPHLRIKGAQATLLLKLRAVKDLPGHHRPLTTEALANRQAIRDEIRTLNGH